MTKRTAPGAATPLAASNSIFTSKLGQRRFRKTPRCMYFYYIGLDSQGRKVVKHYYYADGDKEIEPEDVERIVTSLAENAIIADEDQQTPPPNGYNWKGMVWTRKSYLAFLLDVPGDDFSGNVFEVSSATTGENHSFFDGVVFSVTLPSHGNGRTDPPVVCCINHMKKGPGGSDLGRQAERYELKLHRTSHSLGDREPDDGGTNMGPPVPPP